MELVQCIVYINHTLLERQLKLIHVFVIILCPRREARPRLTIKSIQTVEIHLVED